MQNGTYRVTKEISYFQIQLLNTFKIQNIELYVLFVNTQNNEVSTAGY